MKVAFFEAEGWEEKMIKEVLPNDEVMISSKKPIDNDLPDTSGFEAISIFIDSPIDKQILDKFPALKLIATRSTGYDHIDLAACKEKGVEVVSVPGYGDNTVAEYAFGLILNLTRKIYQAIDRVKETGSFSQEGLRGIDLKGKTIGVIGTGRIGRESARIAKGFGMNVIAYDPYPNDAFAKEIGMEYKSLDDVLGASDVITIHCPLVDSTRHLINKNNIGKIKRGAYLVNAARGPIVETEAIVQALKDGILAGAGLDVLEEEGETKDELTFMASEHPHEEELKTILRNHVLMKMPNVFITPHNAFNSQEALERILSITLENIKAFEAGKPVNLVKS